MENYLIRIQEPAEKWLKKYNKEVQRHFASKIRKLENNPTIHGKPLRKPLQGYWELYFEHRFRIIYTVDNQEFIVSIVAVKHKDEF